MAEAEAEAEALAMGTATGSCVSSIVLQQLVVAARRISDSLSRSFDPFPGVKAG